MNKKVGCPIIKLLIIADDYTGAMDTGVQFSKRGISTLVRSGVELRLEDGSSSGAQVLVMDIESRHDTPQAAASKVRRVCAQALENGIPHLYKKTDSALRGNIGAELTAFMDSLDLEELVFIPAFPDCRRHIVDGTLYIEGVPVAQTVFGRDKYSPVRHSYVPRIIAEQSDRAVELVGRGMEAQSARAPTIRVYDAASDDDMGAIAGSIDVNKPRMGLAGCAGFAAFLPGLLGLKSDMAPERQLRRGTLIVSGSINDITIEQFRHIRKGGYSVETLTPEQKLDVHYRTSREYQTFLGKMEKTYAQTSAVILESVSSEDEADLTEAYALERGLAKEDIRRLVMCNLGEIVKDILGMLPVQTLVVFGGDTLIGIIAKLGASGVLPERELFPGTVAGTLVGAHTDLAIVSKSGGFGHRDIIQSILELCV